VAAGQTEATIRLKYTLDAAEAISKLREMANLQQQISRGSSSTHRAGTPSPGGAGGGGAPGSNLQLSQLNASLLGLTVAVRLNTLALTRLNVSLAAFSASFGSPILNEIKQTNFILRSISSGQTGGRGGLGGGGNDGLGDRGDSMITRWAKRLGFLAAAYVARNGLQFAASAATISQQADLTGSQKTRQITENIPIVGALIKSLRQLQEAIDGTAAAISRHRLIGEFAQANISSQFEMVSAASSGRIQQGLAMRRYKLAGEAAAMGAPPIENYDRSTVAGQQAQQRADLMAPLQDALAQAQREAKAVGGGVGQADNEVSLARKNAAAARRALDAATAEIDAIRERENAPSGGNGPLPSRLMNGTGAGRLTQGNVSVGDIANIIVPGSGTIPNLVQGAATGGGVEAGNRAQAVQQAQAAAQAHGLALEQLKEKEEALQRAIRARGEANAAVARANMAIMRQELELLNQREQAMSSSAQSLGMMNPLERTQGMEALRQIQNRGIENVPHFMLGMANGIAPGITRGLAEQAGANSNEMFELRQRGEFGDESRTLSELRQVMVDLKNNMRTLDLEKEAQLTNSNLNAIQSTLGNILQVIKRQAILGQQKVDINQFAQSQNNGN